MNVIGLTGGIAAGKTMITDYLLRLGACVVDADSLSRRLTEPGSPVLKEIAAAFGEEYIDEAGALRRKSLGGLIFSHEPSRLKLNQILHPRIIAACGKELARLREKGEPAAVLSAPLLLEVGLDSLTDQIWVVSLAPERQLRRLMDRDGITEEDAKKRLAAQSSLREKLAKAHRVIDNGGSPEETRQRVRALWEEVCGQSG